MKRTYPELIGNPLKHWLCSVQYNARQCLVPVCENASDARYRQGRPGVRSGRCRENRTTEKFVCKMFLQALLAGLESNHSDNDRHSVRLCTKGQEDRA